MHLHLYLVLPRQQDNYSKAPPLSGSDKKKKKHPPWLQSAKVFLLRAKGHMFEKHKIVRENFTALLLNCFQSSSCLRELS